jgi:hypothetical protein
MLVASSVCSALNHDYPCLHLQISIKNNTPNTCYLLTEELTNDSLLSPKQDLSFKILPNAQSPFIDISPYLFTEGASIELVYECGEGYYIRLNSQKNECGNDNKVMTSVLYAANLSATAENTPANYWSNQPAKVIWSIQ